MNEPSDITTIHALRKLDAEVIAKLREENERLKLRWDEHFSELSPETPAQQHE